MLVTAIAALLVVLAGMSFGATSIGGILVLPALTGVLQLDVTRVPTCAGCASQPASC